MVYLGKSWFRVTNGIIVVIIAIKVNIIHILTSKLFPRNKNNNEIIK